MSGNSSIHHGWIDEPDGRGTWSILSSCILTIILCCWTTVFPNIPAKSDGFFAQWRQKFDLACIGLLGPEFLLMLALGQWSSARTSVKKFQAMGHQNWTITHAFFADMGGFLLDAPGSPEFPLDAEQLRVLVKGRYVEYPEIAEEDIQDKSKSNTLSLLLAVLQATWFIVNCIIRYTQHLAISTLELTTASFILVFFITSWCWRHKPLDISRPYTLRTTTSIDEIRAENGQGPLHYWHRTPLDFISRKEWFCSQFWHYYIQILHHMKIPLFSRPATRPYNRIPSDNFPIIDSRGEIICGPIILLFCSLFMTAWTFEFPSQTERLLWRIASVYVLCFGVFGLLFSGYCHFWLLGKDKAGKGEYILQSNEIMHDPIKGNLDHLVTKLRNIDLDRDPDLEVPLRVLIPLTILCALYSLSRAFVLIEDLIGLRSLPESAFQTVSWSKYLPHW